jgi:hypothetical protein
MDAAQRFRQRVARELGDRQGTERRYSAGLRAAAVAYWRTREVAGDGLQQVALALGVAPMSLRRWAQEPTLRRVQLVPDEGTEPRVVVTITADGVRVEGLDLDTAARFVARLR